MKYSNSRHEPPSPFSGVTGNRESPVPRFTIRDRLQIKCGIIVYTTRDDARSKVGIREFRENLSSYLESETPVAITRHGTTIGIYLPTRRKPSEADLEALRAAGEHLDALISAAGATEDELFAAFKQIRGERRRGRRKKSG